MQQPLYGLIGSKLGHSYSKIIHEQIADYTYELMPLPTEAEVCAFLEKRAFTAINVTIPYKQLVIPYCDEVDPRAAAIGAVNTVVNRGGRLYGYNTDYAGFAYLAKSHGGLPRRRCKRNPDRQPHRPRWRAALRRGYAPPRCADYRQHNALRDVPQRGPMPD